jgi:hypothetical protein
MSKHSCPVGRQTRREIMRTRTNACVTRWLKTSLLVGCFLAALTVLTIFTFASASAQSVPRPSAAKQQLVESQARWHAVVDQKHAPKGTDSINSCPVDLHHAAVINRLTSAQMVGMHHTYTSFASVISVENKPYYIFGEDGKFVVQALALDPCQANLIQQQKNKQTFQAPQQGDLIIQSVQGDLVTYQAPSGAVGIFNFVTGQFR